MPKRSALVELSTVDAVKYVFDPDHVTAVYVMPLARLELPRALFEERTGIAIQEAAEAMTQIAGVGPQTTHVFGIVLQPLAISENPLAFLQRLAISDEFVLLTSLAGDIRIKAAAVTWLLPKYPGITDPRVRCVVGIGGSSNLFPVFEDVSTVRSRIDNIRGK